MTTYVIRESIHVDSENVILLAYSNEGLMKWVEEYPSAIKAMESHPGLQWMDPEPCPDPGVIMVAIETSNLLEGIA